MIVDTHGAALASGPRMQSALTAIVFTVDRVRTVLLALSFIILIKCSLVLTALALAG
ncbi:MAG: hypothetical protein HY054_00185 [Proteobacteria bacterium]|nr:hypothetical protein [Pseudomonadota bacterium]